MTEHNTQLNTGVELCGKSKWEVRRRWSDFYCAYSWDVLNPDGLLEGAFTTWREALTYADEQARTVEVTLPRAIKVPDNAGAADWDFGEWSGLSYTPTWPETAFYDRRNGPIGRHFQGEVSIRREHWKPLALALLALHYGETRQSGVWPEP